MVFAQDIGGKTSSFRVNLGNLTPQIDHLGKMSNVLRVSSHFYGVFEDIDGKTFIFRVNLRM